jgi:hypothetical protein
MEKQEQSKAMYEYINNNASNWLEEATAAGISEGDATIFQKVAQECSEEDFVSFMETGELTGSVSLSDDEMKHLKGGANNNIVICCFFKTKPRDEEDKPGRRQGRKRR